MKPNQILKSLFIWQTAIIFITLIAIIFIPYRHTYLGGATQAYLSQPLVYSRANFDGNHYLTIAKLGYGYSQQAFFPLYPKLIKVFQPMIGSAVIAGIIISLVSFTLGLYLFNKLLLLDYPRSVVRFVIISLLLFPVSFFFSFVYTEGTFFLFTIASFYFARKNHWLVASLFGFLAAYTRFTGIFIFIALLIELWQSRQFNFRHLLFLGLIPLGLFIYMNYLNISVGDPLAFIHVQTAFNQGRSTDIILLYRVFWRYFRMLVTVNQSDPLFMTIVLEAGIGIVFFITSTISLFRHRLSYAVFGLCSYLLPTLTGTFTSLPRYALICFPSFILIGEAFSKASPGIRRLFLLGSAILFIIYLSLFIRGYWVS